MMRVRAVVLVLIGGTACAGQTPASSPDAAPRSSQAFSFVDEILRSAAETAEAEYAACLRVEERIADARCDAGTFPDGREHPGVGHEACVAMWIDGIPDTASARGIAGTREECVQQRAKALQAVRRMLSR